MVRWAVGVEETGGVLRLVALRKRGRTIEWVDRLEIPTRDFDRELLQGWLKRYEKALWAAGLEARQLLVRPLELRLKRRKDIDTAFPLQLETLLPCSLEQLVVEKEIGDPIDGATPVTAFAAPRTTVGQLRHRLDQLLGEGWEPDQIGAEPIALKELCQWLGVDLTSQLILRRTDEGACLVLLDQGMVRAVHAIPETDADSVAQEVYRFQQACAQRWRLKIPETLLLLCDDPVVEGPLADQLLTTQLQEAPEGTVTYAGALGFALGALRGQVNFAQGEFAHSRPWVRLRKPIRKLTLAIFALLVALGLLGYALLHHQAARVRAGYAQLIERTELPGSLASLLEPPTSLSFSHYEKRIGLIETALSSQSGGYALAPNVPQVRELIGWLNGLPELAGASPLVRLEKLHYSLVQRPETGRPLTPYRVKVDLTLSSRDANAARLLHQRLLTADSLADTISGISWNGSGNQYTSSFYLKSREPR